MTPPFIKDDFQLPTLEVADEQTAVLHAKMGKVMWAMAELEVDLPEDAAGRVSELKRRVAEDLGRIIRKVGTYKVLSS